MMNGRHRQIYRDFDALLKAAKAWWQSDRLPACLPAVQIEGWEKTQLLGADPLTQVSLRVSSAYWSLAFDDVTDDTAADWLEELARVTRECGSLVKALQLVAKIAHPPRKNPAAPLTNGHANGNVYRK